MGASGRVGQLLQQAWRSASRDASLITQARSESADLIWSPLEDGPDALRKAIEGFGTVKAVICLLGAPSHGRDEAFAEAAPLARAVMKGAKSAGITRVLMASSSAVYGIGQNLAETAALDPAGGYGRAKQVMELAARAACGPDQTLCFLRIGNIAGADTILTQAGRVSPDAPILMDQFEDGQGPERSYIGPGTLADVLERLATTAKPLPAALNVGTTPPVAMTDLADAAGLPWNWVTAAPDRAPTQRITLDCTELQRIVGARMLQSSAEDMIRQLRQYGVLG